ncbi:MAG TPA: SPFH domain-containing protein [Polyangiaceae bacterium]|jgi:regulator of protease activity HflC (stomatin/prohibitin superfamily)|nr:SPFH domain-containing protein [Polyangiaceae bacterium]
MFSFELLGLGLMLGFFAIPIALFWARFFSFYVIVREGEAVVFELFGNVRMVLTEPGLYSPWATMGPLAALIPIFGKRQIVDMRLDQSYLRSLPVNSEEGAPMGIGVWCEMKVSDPVAYLYKNTNPKGSLRANISNATVRCLSNMKLVEMLEERHAMSRTVREEVSRESRQWGYLVGSVYVRKVHFRDVGMISQIEQKVVNRLRQVTAAIQQEGTNRVNVIRSAAEREAAIEFAKAAATRPRIVGGALSQIVQSPAIASAMFEVLETQAALQSPRLSLDIVPEGTPIWYGVANANPSLPR